MSAVTNRAELQGLARELSSLAVFAKLLDKLPFAPFLSMMAAEDDYALRRAHGELVHSIYRDGGDLTAMVTRAVFEDENPYVLMRAGKHTCAPVIADALCHELSVLSRFASLTPASLAALFSVDAPSTPFASHTVELAAAYETRMQDIHKHGYGIFASNAMFRLSDQATVEPVGSPDTVTMDNFIGYAEEREQILANTRAFLAGRPAANVLLYGDAGTGKSSTVKAIVNSLFEDGLRLIEIRKDQLSYLPFVMGKIRQNPLHFIIFIDDLSFNKSDDCFSMLKAALEGSASAKADNAVIYATSNRRHIVRETFSDREGGEVHRNDTMQETLSLSERFGMTVLFERPNKALYLTIVRTLAERYGLAVDTDELCVKAEAFALSRGTRSARCAEQFIKSLL